MQAVEFEQEIVDALMIQLEEYADIQKYRRLTMEEMMLIFQLVIHLFTATQYSFSKQLEITIQGKKIVLPFSKEFLRSLYQLQEEIERLQEELE